MLSPNPKRSSCPKVVRSHSRVGSPREGARGRTAVSSPAPEARNPLHQARARGAARSYSPHEWVGCPPSAEKLHLMISGSVERRLRIGRALATPRFCGKRPDQIRFETREQRRSFLNGQFGEPPRYSTRLPNEYSNGHRLGVLGSEPDVVGPAGTVQSLPCNIMSSATPW